MPLGAVVNRTNRVVNRASKTEKIRIPVGLLAATLATQAVENGEE